VIANRHGVIAEGVHLLRSGAAFIISVEQRALELIAGIKQHNIIGRTADVRDGPGETRCAAQAFILGLLRLATNRSKRRCCGETAMHIIGVQNGEVERIAERRCTRG